MSSISKIAQKYMLREDESVRSILFLSALFDSYGKGMYGLHCWGLKWFKKYHERGIYFQFKPRD
jgi:hypothetical protein